VHTKKIILLLCFFLPGFSSVFAAQYKLAVQPVLPAAEIRKNYKPLADYLSAKSGHEIVILTHRNFLTYWEKMKKWKNFDLVLDAAHFTDFRVQRKKYRVIAKFPDTVSFTVVTNEDNFVFEMEELVLRKVATMASPGLGAIRMAAMFPNPVRLPVYVQATDSVDAVNKLLTGKVVAAIIPTPLVGNYGSLNTVLTTDPVPHMGFSVSPDVPNDVVEKIRIALIEAKTTKEGKKMLVDMNIEKFSPATNEIYKGYAELLEGVFGY